MKKKLLINGMSCSHCVRHVEEALTELDGVISAKASLEGKNAVVELDKEISYDIFKEAIEEAGYELVGVQDM
jgi:copper ion binding protein